MSDPAPGNLSAPPAPETSLSRLRRYYTDATSLMATARAASLVCFDFYDSDQYTGDELQRLARRNQPPIVINQIKPAINGLLGVADKARSQPHCWPRTPGDTESADAASEILRYVADHAHFRRTRLDAFRDCLIAGAGAVLIGCDPDLNVTVTPIRWEELFFDPRSRRPDFADARYLGIAKWMYADDIEALYPGAGRLADLAIDASGGAGVAMDDAGMDRPHSGAAQPWFDRKARRVLVIELYYKETGQWRRCVHTGADILEDGPSPFLDHKGRPDCPIEAMSAYVKRDNSRYGAVADMLDPQREYNKRRSAALHRMVAKQVEVADPIAIGADVEVARSEAARPDGVLPPGFRFADNRADIAGQIELMEVSRGEIDRMALNPAVVGRSGTDPSGRALLARQQAGLLEFGPLFSGLEDWELRCYRQMWARARQYWRAPQFIRVTDDENAPRFVGVNQPLMDGQGGVLGYENAIAEMDVDITVDTQQDSGSLLHEAFLELVQLVGNSQVYQQQVGFDTLLELSPIPHKQAILDEIAARRQQAAQAQAQAQAVALAEHQARIGEMTARTAELSARAPLHGATGFAKSLDALTYAHQAHAETAVAGLTHGIQAGTDQAAQASDQAHPLFRSPRRRPGSRSASAGPS